MQASRRCADDEYADYQCSNIVHGLFPGLHGQRMKARAPRPSAAAPVDLHALPGHQIRRLHQIAVAIFLQEAEGTGITPVQFAALQTVADRPGVDQKTLARGIGLDTSTVAGVVDRLEARGLLQRHASPNDRRVRRLTATPAGQAALAELTPAMLRAQQRILWPLNDGERKNFVRMLDRLVSSNNELSRAPSDSD